MSHASAGLNRLQALEAAVGSDDTGCNSEPLMAHRLFWAAAVLEGPHELVTAHCIAMEPSAPYMPSKEVSISGARCGL